MEVDVESDAAIAGPSAVSLDVELMLTAPSQKPASHVQMMRDILVALHGEIDTEAGNTLQIVLQQLSMDVNLQSELLSTKKWEEVLPILLKHTNDDLGLVIKALNELLPTVIADLDQEVLLKMKEISETISKEDEIFMLSEKSILHGREEELQTLRNAAEFRKEAGKAKIRTDDLLLVNVCGMPGIGKSFLIQHFGLKVHREGRSNVIYVEASGLSSKSDLIVNILQHPKVDKVASGQADDMVGTLNEFLLENKQCDFIFILDDLSTLMSDVKQTKEIFMFLNDLIMLSQRKVNIKVFVTSQVHFTMTTERAEIKELVAIKRLMADYTKDVTLSTVSNEVAKMFLRTSLQSLSNKEETYILKRCAGHPLTLHWVSAIASSDFTSTTEISKVSDEDIDALNEEVADEVLQKAFNKLAVDLKWILLTVALFDRDAKLGALYYILDPKQPRQDFYDQVKKQLSNGFWLMFRASGVKKESMRKTVVNAHHPLIMKFLKKQINSEIDGSFARDADITILKERFISYHLSELVEIGKDCVPSETSHSPYFVRKTCGRFMQDRTNFRKALSFILESNNPLVIFSAGSGTTKLKETNDIMYLFLCLHQYHDCFDGFLIKTITELVNRNISEPQHRVLMWALFVMVLTVEQKWRTLDAVFKDRSKDFDPKLICSSQDSDLFRFIKAIYGYADGAMHTHASWLRDRKDAFWINKRKTSLEMALENLSGWVGVGQYFSIYILLVLAEATWVPSRENVPVIKEAFAICESAQNFTQQVLILKPAVYAELASYKAIEGNVTKDLHVASDLYAQAEKFYQTVAEEFKYIKMDRTIVAARNLSNYGVHMRSWAYLLTENNPVPEELRKAAEEYLKKAVHHTQCAAEIFASMGRANKLDLLRSYHEVAFSLERLQYETPEIERRLHYESFALKYYRKAYHVIRKDYRSCNLSPEDFTLNALIKRLPVLMRNHAASVEMIDKVEAKLLEIREEARKETDRDIDHSGSEPFSSSDSSSDDELIDNKINFYLGQSIPLPISTSSHTSEPSSAEQARAQEPDTDTNQLESIKKKARKFFRL